MGERIRWCRVHRCEAAGDVCALGVALSSIYVWEIEGMEEIGEPFSGSRPEGCRIVLADLEDLGRD